MAAAVKTANEKAAFAAGLSKLTGLSPSVAAAWVLQENAGTGHLHNWLAIRPGVGATKGKSGVPLTTDKNGFAIFSSEADALKETAWWINNKPQYAPIKASAGKTAAAQITAISLSPWDAGHYASGGKIGGALLNTFHSLQIGASAGVSGSVPSSSGGGFLSSVESAAKTAGGVALQASAVVNPITAPAVLGYDVLTGGLGSGVSSAIGDAGKSIVNLAIEGLIEIVLLVLAAALFYTGIRRLTGDALPSASELRQNTSQGLQTAAVAAA
jgi:hypothetical protein